MKSHEYHIRRTELVGLVLSLLIPMVACAVILRLGALSGVLPAPWPALDVDRTILTHQAQATRTRTSVDVVLIGDSSCLMDASAKRVQEVFGGRHSFMNLGTSMHVGLSGYAAMLSHFADVNPDHLRLVVVLLHPEMLRGIEPVPQDLAFISDYYSGSDYRDMASVQGQICGMFGLDIVRDRIWSRFPLPLPKEYGRFYGFNLDLDDFMQQQRGSAVDPHQFVARPGQGNAEYRFSPALANGCLALRLAAPPKATVLIGITPIPESFAPVGYGGLWQGIYGQWAKCMEPVNLLTNLPPTMSDLDFASTTHLNQQGSLKFSVILAKSLEPYLEK